MRCREAQSRISGSRREAGKLHDDVELQQHLRSCPKCAEEARAAGLLESLFEVGTESDRVDLLTLEQVKRRVERVVDHPTPAERAARRRLVQPWWLRKPVIGMSMLAAVMALAASFVPLEYYQTIGYDIRFGGVRPELVEGEDHICDMLSSLGLDDASVDVLGCDSTCSLRILDLKTSEEVNLVASALRNVNRSHLTVKVTPLRRAASGTLLDRAHSRLFDRTT